jgi:hypothetical protein
MSEYFLCVFYIVLKERKKERKKEIFQGCMLIIYIPYGFNATHHGTIAI